MPAGILLLTESISLLGKCKSQRVGHDWATELSWADWTEVSISLGKYPEVGLLDRVWIKFVIRSFQTTLPLVMFKFQLFHTLTKCQVLFFFNVSLWKFPTSKKVERTVLYWTSTYSSAAFSNYLLISLGSCFLTPPTTTQLFLKQIPDVIPFYS